jgi:hypothetical protein
MDQGTEHTPSHLVTPPAERRRQRAEALDGSGTVHDMPVSSDVSITVEPARRTDRPTGG